VFQLFQNRAKWNARVPFLDTPNFPIFPKSAILSQDRDPSFGGSPEAKSSLRELGYRLGNTAQESRLLGDFLAFLCLLASDGRSKIKYGL